MPRITRYHYLNHDELLRLFIDKRDCSDIIEEICQRLERELGDGPLKTSDEKAGHQDTVNCPVCDAELCVEDTGVGYHLKVI